MTALDTTVHDETACPNADLDNRAKSESSIAIRVCGVQKTFTLHNQGGVQLSVLSDVDLEVRRGEILALTGPSGSGKSTLLRCLYGNYLPTQGSICLRHDEELVELSTADPSVVIEMRRRTVGWVSQFLRVIPRVPTIEIVAEPIVATGALRDEAIERAANLLRRLNIPERLWSLAPATFSGGEQQRVNVARGLAASHPILLVDEPTASLDVANRYVVCELLTEAKERGAAIVGIFHDVEVRDRIATRSVDVSGLNTEFNHEKSDEEI